MGFVRLGFVFLACFGVFLYYGTIRAPRLQRPWSIIMAVLLTLVILASVAWLVINRTKANLDAWRPFTAPTASLLPVILYFGMGLILISLVNAGWSIGQVATGVGHLEVQQLIHTSRLVFVRIATVVALIGAIGVTGYGYHEATNPRLTQTAVTSTDLPAEFDGFRIALLSDIHVGVGLGRGFVQSLVQQVNDAKPDLIVIAGDLSNGSPQQLGDDLLPLTELKAPYGVLVTTGNHEFDVDGEAWVAWLDGHGLPVLNNSGVVLTRGTASIDVLGINDRVGTPPLQPDLQAAAQQLHDSAGVPVDGAGRFRILIAHEPLQVSDGDDLPAKLGVDLQLSGHTHGGQIWPINYLVTLQQPALDGTHLLDGVTVVTSRGAGAWGPPIRVGAPPEIPIVTLHRS